MPRRPVELSAKIQGPTQPWPSLIHARAHRGRGSSRVLLLFRWTPDGLVWASGGELHGAAGELLNGQDAPAAAVRLADDVDPAQRLPARSAKSKREGADWPLRGRWSCRVTFPAPDDATPPTVRLRRTLGPLRVEIRADAGAAAWHWRICRGKSWSSKAETATGTAPLLSHAIRAVLLQAHGLAAQRCVADTLHRRGRVGGASMVTHTAADVVGGFTPDTSLQLPVFDHAAALQAERARMEALRAATLPLAQDPGTQTSYDVEAGTARTVGRDGRAVLEVTISNGRGKQGPQIQARARGRGPKAKRWKRWRKAAVPLELVETDAGRGKIRAAVGPLVAQALQDADGVADAKRTRKGKGRRATGVPVPPELAAHDELVGTVADKVVAAMAGVPVTMVRNYRRAKGIPSIAATAQAAHSADLTIKALEKTERRALGYAEHYAEQNDKEGAKIAAGVARSARRTIERIRAGKMRSPKGAERTLNVTLHDLEERERRRDNRKAAEDRKIKALIYAKGSPWQTVLGLGELVTDGPAWLQEHHPALGLLPDTEVAKRAGVSAGKIRRARRDLGIWTARGPEGSRHWRRRIGRSLDAWHQRAKVLQRDVRRAGYHQLADVLKEDVSDLAATIKRLQKGKAITARDVAAYGELLRRVLEDTERARRVLDDASRLDAHKATVKARKAERQALQTVAAEIKALRGRLGSAPVELRQTARELEEQAARAIKSKGETLGGPVDAAEVLRGGLAELQQRAAELDAQEAKRQATTTELRRLGDLVAELEGRAQDLQARDLASRARNLRDKISHHAGNVSRWPDQTAGELVGLKAEAETLSAQVRNAEAWTKRDAQGDVPVSPQRPPLPGMVETRTYAPNTRPGETLPERRGWSFKDLPGWSLHLTRTGDGDPLSYVIDHVGTGLAAGRVDARSKDDGKAAAVFLRALAERLPASKVTGDNDGSGLTGDPAIDEAVQEWAWSIRKHNEQVLHISRGPDRVDNARGLVAALAPPPSQPALL